MKTTKPAHAWKRHVGISLVTGDEVEFYEPVAPQEQRGKIIRRILGWNRGETMYPLTERCEAQHAREAREA